jgi:hypothetical protein
MIASVWHRISGYAKVWLNIIFSQFGIYRGVIIYDKLPSPCCQLSFAGRVVTELRQRDSILTSVSDSFRATILIIYSERLFAAEPHNN